MSASTPASRGNKHGGRCAHVHSKTKTIIDRLKVLVPYANVCRHRQALLQGRRGAGTTTVAHGDREATPAPGDGDRSRKRLVDEMPAPTCTQCHTPVDRLHACLSCDFYGCWRPRTQNASHIVEHLKEHGHPFALDFARQAVFCMECNDYVYDSTVQSWLMAAQIRWHAALCDSAEPEAKRPRIVSTGADLSPAQTKYLKEHGAVLGCAGVRGLYNLGATCYLSVVLQALVHNPLMRGWMLSDGHHKSSCRVGRPLWLRTHQQQQQQQQSSNVESTIDDEVTLGGGRIGSTEVADACMACELETSFQAFFSGDTTPFGPVKLLRTLWLLRSDLAGYGQQDAHECLMAMLDTLHVGFTENVLGPDSVEHSFLHPCQCLVHQAFAGVLQSTVTCQRCGNTTHAHDPMLDISLDIPTKMPALAPKAIDAALNEWLETRSPHAQPGRSRRGPGPRAHASLTKGVYPVLTLNDCLAHYTRAEPLPMGAYTCDRCSTADATAIKQLCIKELPPVLTFQLKRFEHASRSSQGTSKMDAFVHLPLHIDMTPYTASALASHSQTVAGLRAAAGNATSSTGSLLPASVGGVQIHSVDEPAEMPRDTPIPVLDGPGGSATLGKRRTDATHSNPACQYSLFAVIDHIGHLDTGHYTAYARHRGQWYRFDDAQVTPADIRDVLGLAEENKARMGRPSKGKAYMAFYVKSVLDYHDGTDKGGQQQRESAPPTQTAMGASNTKISESGELIEEAGVVRTRINASGDVKVERRGRKKGSTNQQRAKSNKPKQDQPPTVAAVVAMGTTKPVKKSKPRTSQPTVSRNKQPEEGELADELDEYMASGTLDVFAGTSSAMVLDNKDGSESDSDGEALWARFSKDMPVDELVPMNHMGMPNDGLRNDRPLFVSPTDLASSPPNKSSAGFSYDDNDEDDDDNSDFA
ncbi:hypothetical protein H4R99_005797 [Coemansia sp. RSA 1722]|nr:hypothetical protein IWW45_006487 [Coemansia sp. RSA 485]KAJ2594391.1 hypothetical protein H4R99_005797 [Coemansia sp. RSA 1722]